VSIGMILAAHGQTSGAEFVIGLVVILVVFLVGILAQASAHYDVFVKNGLPYCSRCNRQVSYRREYCRACGYKYKTFGGLPVDTTVEQSNASQRAEARRLAWKLREAERHEKKRATEAVKAARRAERDKAYRAMGIEPGPWAWYQALPVLKQAIVLGLAFGLPAGLALIVLFRFLSPFGPR
jgi:RNA polymerase subunit RPABC4/transcription elongation factor Spt4